MYDVPRYPEIINVLLTQINADLPHEMTVLPPKGQAISRSEHGQIVNSQ
jgi:hypothetical protein